MKSMKKNLVADAWRKTWHFLWHEDSILSWVVNVLLVFLIIKFLLYPGLGLVTGTKFPVVAVVSSSMEHRQPFNEWWPLHENVYSAFGIAPQDFEDYPFSGGFNRGDIIVLTGKQPSEIDVGDVIVYSSRKPYPIIHRVVEVEPTLQKFQTKGDNNIGQIVSPELNEQNVPFSALLGKAVFRIPYLGYVKIVFVEGLNKLGIPVKG